AAQPAAPAAAAPPAPAAATANAQTGAATVQGGGATAGDNTQLIAALQGVIQAITALVSVLKAQVAGASGGGAPGKTPTQAAPGKTPEQTPPAKTPEPIPAPPVAPPVTQVAGANGGAAPTQEAPQKEPTQVAGANGGVIQQMPTQAPPAKIIFTPPGTAVGGASGAPEKIVEPAPIKFVPPAPPVAPPTQVGGAKGGPVQQTPTQSPIQSPTQVGGANGGGVAAGDVTLSNTDADFRATLTSKSGDSVSIWGDPHVTIKVGGKEDSFLIGYGPGSAQLSDGSIVSWDTNPVGGAREKLLKGFTVDSAGTTLDRTVTTGDKKDEKGLTTALSDVQLKEFATALRSYEGDWKLPLKLKDTPAQK
ncbi:MAG: hypothetical protein H7287_11530, partial [Thermoleophilia bacterium]|nr:hypothetical protein [Thermoleophilia bacterium]